MISWEGKKVWHWNFVLAHYLSFLSMYPSYSKTTVWYALVMAKSQLDPYKLWQNHNLIYPSYGNTVTSRYPLISMKLTDSPFMSFYDPKIRETQRIWSMESLTCCPTIYTYLKRSHIFVKFLVYSVKLDKPLLVVTFFYFLLFNYTSVYFLKNMFTNVS